MAHLYVIAGHGAGDCGAVGYGYTEAERVRALASRLSALGGGNVTVADMNRNWYADNGIMSLNIPKDWQNFGVAHGQRRSFGKRRSCNH